ncbi:MAG: 50S ribosomal protein L32 [Candidatus Magasanikbacteria bacterium]|nr:50S ribosomal protein L32 [Candidatus Magasanikbacteria bacterium]
MGLPSKRRTARSKRDRASHFALKAVGVAKCGECGAFTLPHRACAKCGFYKGRKMVDKQKRAARLAKRKKMIGK